MTIQDLFAGRAAISTSEVASFLDVDETTARDFAEEQGLDRLGAAFMWLQADVEALVDDLADDDPDDLDSDPDNDDPDDLDSDPDNDLDDDGLDDDD